MAGYNGYSMSNNAVTAYSNGEKPLSKWTRSAILTAIAHMIVNEDLPVDTIGQHSMSWMKSAFSATLATEMLCV